MHSANIETSGRLARTLRYLQACGSVGASTAEIQTFTNSMAPGTDVSELRSNGYNVECKYEGRSSTGRKVYRYALKGRRAEKAE